MARNNNLSSKTPIHSDLHDVEKELGFSIEMDTSPMQAETTPEEEYDMTLGWHKVRAIKYAEVPAAVGKDRFGNDYDIPAHYSIIFKDIKTEETSELIVYMDKKSMNSFKRGINQRSGKDLGWKLANAGIKLTDVSVKTVARYVAKYPIDMLYQFSQWIDKDSGDLIVSKRPKLQLWVQADFEKKEISYESLQ